MAEKKPQTFANHTRWDPLYHFFVLPVFFLSVVGAIIHFVRHSGLHSGWLFLLSVAATVAVLKARFYAVRVQDRIIRLEERLRLQALLPAEDRAHINELSIKQLIALRFASDDELPALVRKTLTQNLEPKAIKQSIVNWRGDYYRV